MSDLSGWFVGGSWCDRTLDGFNQRSVIKPLEQ